MNINHPVFRYLYLIILAATQLYGSSIEAASIKWSTDFKAAAKESTRTQKPILVEIGATWCGYCTKMKTETFTDQQIVKHVNGCFVPVLLDADVNERLAEAIGFEALPTTVIISPKSQIMLRLTGYHTSAELMRELRRVCKHPKKANPAETAKLNGQQAVGAGFAFGKYCLVSMVEDHHLVKGSDDLTSIYQGRRICFASPEYKQRFEKNPASYWPVNDGNCPITAVERHKLMAGDPSLALIYNKRVYFFASDAEQTTFKDAPNEYSRKLAALTRVSADSEKKSTYLK